MDVTDRQYPYNNYAILPDISRKIIDHLLKDERANVLWKLLNGQTNEDWNSPDITIDEKRNLIYTGYGDSTQYSVFMDMGMEDGVYQKKAFLRIAPVGIYPTNRTVGVIDIGFEIFVDSKANHLSNYKTRMNMILQNLLECLNGTDIGGLGVVFFNHEMRSSNKMYNIGQVPYKGSFLVASINVG